MGQTIAGANPSTSVHSTTPGVVSLSLGGVGRNIAEACHRIISTRSPVLQSATMLVSLVGNDPFGKLLREETQQLGMRVDGLVESDKRSAVCNIVLDSVGGLIGGVADMDIIHSLDSRTVRGSNCNCNVLSCDKGVANQVLEQIEKHRPGLVALDGNLSEDTIRAVVKHCYAQDTEGRFSFLWLCQSQLIGYFSLLVRDHCGSPVVTESPTSEPTSIPRSASVFPAVAAILDELDPSRSPVTFTSPNMLELAHMYAAASAEPFTLTSHNSWWKTIDAFSLGAEFRMDLEQLARQRASEHDSTRGSLSFLVEKGLAQMALHLLPFFQNIFIKCGDLGVIVAMRISGPAVQTSGWAERHSDARNRCVIGRSGGGQELIVFKHFPAFTLAQGAVVNVTGAGDSFVGSLLASLLLNPVALHPKSLSQTIHSAQRAAVLTLQSSRAVSPKLSSDECGDVVEHA
jgi:pseudouridine-5'-phosphate glycosidase/pseudouridine kinase